MTDHSHVRSYHEALRRLGIQNPGDVPFRTPVQAVALVDDLRQLARPLELPSFGGGAIIAAGVGLNGSLRLTAGINGARVLFFGEGTNAQIFITSGTVAGFTSVAVIVPALRFGDIVSDQTAVLDEGTRVAGVGEFTPISQFQQFPWRMWLPAGHVFEFMNDTQNDTFEPWMVWEEVPARSALNPPE